jgi:hypothetical protein
MRNDVSPGEERFKEGLITQHIFLLRIQHLSILSWFSSKTGILFVFFKYKEYNFTKIKNFR